ncbi:SUF system FeS assembly protein, NifU family [Gemmatirosa kalamazoonensis]|uniref:SUF system FeS assembly protein, NifU family n=1 Tax=Gemmatirosa kalamazoonensis TaxID=861299 RepID=W0RFP3_9BACT|nr:SUF system NifU family Fe-S cluster assembly protein [Gemmatirosa kalamazoonensis]AHG89621.1 SUF system FeS assembly protein, NifU family [Gemmatirosa kalamazoonensis]
MSTRSAPDEAQLAAIYQELILDHYRRPRNRGPLDAPDARTARRKNPLCGDELTLALAFDADGRVREARFIGQGCSISQASASMLTEAVRGKTRAEVEALLARFRALMQGDADAAADESLGELRALSGVARFPSRVQCATLPWSALAELL